MAINTNLGILKDTKCDGNLIIVKGGYDPDMWKLIKPMDWMKHTSQAMFKQGCENSIVIRLYVDKGEKTAPLAGFVIANSDYARTTYVEDLVVSPEYKGQGFGSKLMRELEDLTKTKKYLLMSSDEGYDFYKHIGYRDSRMDAKFMTKKIKW